MYTLTYKHTTIYEIKQSVLLIHDFIFKKTHMNAEVTLPRALICEEPIHICPLIAYIKN